jgi:hypothetical protein
MQNKGSFMVKRWLKDDNSFSWKENRKGGILFLRQ